MLTQPLASFSITTLIKPNKKDKYAHTLNFIRRFVMQISNIASDSVI